MRLLLPLLLLALALLVMGDSSSSEEKSHYRRRSSIAKRRYQPSQYRRPMPYPQQHSFYVPQPISSRRWLRDGSDEVYRSLKRRSPRGYNKRGPKRKRSKGSSSSSEEKSYRKRRSKGSSSSSSSEESKKGYGSLRRKSKGSDSNSGSNSDSSSGEKSSIVLQKYSAPGYAPAPKSSYGAPKPKPTPRKSSRKSKKKSKKSRKPKPEPHPATTKRLYYPVFETEHPQAHAPHRVHDSKETHQVHPVKPVHQIHEVVQVVHPTPGVPLVHGDAHHGDSLEQLLVHLPTLRELQNAHVPTTNLLPEVDYNSYVTPDLSHLTSGPGFVKKE